jgi:hypothetical protein
MSARRFRFIISFVGLHATKCFMMTDGGSGSEMLADILLIRRSKKLEENNTRFVMLMNR